MYLEKFILFLRQICTKYSSVLSYIIEVIFTYIQKHYAVMTDGY